MLPLAALVWLATGQLAVEEKPKEHPGHAKSEKKA
jgi:hypothetical protein